MRILDLDRFERGLATLRNWMADRTGYALTEISIPAMDLGGQALRVASLSAYVHTSMGETTRLVALARDIRARCVIDHTPEGREVITIQIARALDDAEEAALAAEIQAAARLGGAA